MAVEYVNLLVVYHFYYLTGLKEGLWMDGIDTGGEYPTEESFA